MSKKFKIYLKDSDKIRLADYRVRIVRETDPRKPSENEDLVFEELEPGRKLPSDTIASFKFNDSTFFTTPTRCIEMVSDDPTYWTSEKLKFFAKAEKKILQDWWNGDVFGIVVENWDAKRREWMHCSSSWGLYGKEAMFDELATETNGKNIPICIDDVEMKYEFDNCEMHVNQFTD